MNKQDNSMHCTLSKDALIQRYQSIRAQTENLCRTLTTEDYVIQSHEDVSPPKWHLAHTTWFFENFLLTPYYNQYKLFQKNYSQLFNSYYYGLGIPFPKAKRGLLARPTVKEIYTYRQYVDIHFLNFLELCTEKFLQEMHGIINLGLHHEQQHQELLLMDIKYNLFQDPNFPCFQKKLFPKIPVQKNQNKFYEMEGGIIEIGSDAHDFCFDNELPRHQHILKPYAIAKRLVTNSEYLAFIHDGGYQQARFWLADGWEYIQKHHWQAPLYWVQIDNQWFQFTLYGLKKLAMNEPVMHISYYEADAFARWCGLRLPTEFEWEHFVNSYGIHFPKMSQDEINYHPHPEDQLPELSKLWEWTASAYLPYPGYEIPKTSLGEYNGKFMSNQMVLRGGSCITPSLHARPSYRNFFPTNRRWQFSGIRLAQDE